MRHIETGIVRIATAIDSSVSPQAINLRRCGGPIASAMLMLAANAGSAGDLASPSAAGAPTHMANSGGPVVQVQGGLVRGATDPDGTQIFLGIPYAAPPIGNLRWRPPAPVVPWQGVREASVAPSPCVQADEGWNAEDAKNGSEDCLYLSVNVPPHQHGERLPLLFWIHGGSNRAGSGFGSARTGIYQPAIITVAIEYRLGVFGFLAAPELSAESPHHSSGNYALLDQIAALRWVRDNIAAFGGDPKRVTVAGQSAGAMDVGMLMRSPLARGLFVGAIQESGVLASPRSAAENESLGDQLIKRLHLSTGPQGLAALRHVPADVLLQAAANLEPPSGTSDSLWVDASADGWVLPAGSNDLHQPGGVAAIPLIVGNNTREFTMDATPEQVRNLATTAFGRNAEAALRLYGAATDGSGPTNPVLGSIGTQLITDYLFRCRANMAARWELSKRQRVWRYEFGIPEPGASVVAHNAELRYLFRPKPTEAAGREWPPIQQYWANFVRTGDPNGAGLPNWPDLAQRQAYISFTPQGPKVGADLRGSICRLMYSAG